MKKVASVVVTYNRKELLVENLKMQFCQEYPVWQVFIIDNNSTDGTGEYLRSLGILEKECVTYFKLEENIGGAGGFSFGTQVAYESGADYIWLMDDDGQAANEYTLQNLIESIPDRDYLFLNSLVQTPDGKLSFSLGGKQDTVLSIKAEFGENNIEGVVCPFNSTLISRELITKIGFPNKEFFIKGDENDFLFRSRQVGSYVATVLSSDYYHPQLKIKKRRICNVEVPISVEAPWKEYYRARNYAYMYKRARRYKAIFIELFLIKVYAIILSEDSYNKLKTFKYVMKGIVDGVSERMGKRVSPGA